MKTVTLIALMFTLLAASACASKPTATPTTVAASQAATQASTQSGSQSTPAASPTGPQSTALAASTVAPGEVVKLSGDNYTTSDPFQIVSDSTLEITWNYKGSGPFALWLINVSETVIDLRYDRMLITNVGGEPSGTARQAVIPGTYTLQVEQASGPWTVEIRPSP